MFTLAGVLGTQEIIVILFFLVGPGLVLISFFTYRQGRKRGRLEGRMQEMERTRQQSKSD